MRRDFNKKILLLFTILSFFSFLGLLKSENIDLCKNLSYKDGFLLSQPCVPYRHKEIRRDKVSFGWFDMQKNNKIYSLHKDKKTVFQIYQRVNKNSSVISNPVSVFNGKFVLPVRGYMPFQEVLNRQDYMVYRYENGTYSSEAVGEPSSLIYVFLGIFMAILFKKEVLSVL